MIFDSYFDKVIVINLPGRPERLERISEQLKGLGLSDSFEVFPAIDGNVVKPPPWFKWGNGAWGCLLSHMRVMEGFMSEPNFENKKILILEDDALFFKHAVIMFEQLIDNLKDRDWGQVYLGGQQTQSPEMVTPSLMACQSVNRTHAYAVNGKYVQDIHNALSRWNEYVLRDHHVDRQLEMYHRKKAWPVYAPRWWIAGQNNGLSDVNGRFSRVQWWDLIERSLIRAVPWIHIDCDPYDFDEFLYEEKIKTDINDSGREIDNLMSIASMAWVRRILPAFRGSDVEVSLITEKMRGGVLKLSEVKGKLQEIIDSRVSL